MKIYPIILIVFIFISCNATLVPRSRYSNKIIYQVDFSRSDGNWTLKNNEHSKAIQTENSYDLSVDTNNYFYFSNAPYSTIDFNYSISSKFKIDLEDSLKLGYAGLVYDYIDENNYSTFAITNGGTYKLFQKKNGKHSVLIGTTYFSTINKLLNSQNTLELRRKKHVVELIINNQAIIIFPSEQIKTFVRVGVTVGTHYDDHFTPVKGSFSNFILKRI